MFITFGTGLSPFYIKLTYVIMIIASTIGPLRTRSSRLFQTILASVQLYRKAINNAMDLYDLLEFTLTLRINYNYYEG